MEKLSLNDFTLKVAKEGLLSSSLPTYSNLKSKLALINTTDSNQIEAFFMANYPDMKFSDYHAIRELSKKDEHEYCSNPTASEMSTEHEEILDIDVVYNKLVEQNMIEKSEQDIYEQPHGLSKALFIELLKEYCSNNVEPDIYRFDDNYVYFDSQRQYDFFKREARGYPEIDTYIVNAIEERDIPVTGKFRDGHAVIRNKLFFSPHSSSYSVRAYNVHDIIDSNEFRSTSKERSIDLNNLYISFMSHYGFIIPELEKIPELEQTNKKSKSNTMTL